MGIISFFKKAFLDMKKSAKGQREVDKANFEAVKAESKANFEENRGRNTYAKAKANAKKTWDEAHMTPAERNEKMQKEREAQIVEANKRKEDAQKRLEEAKQVNNKKSGGQLLPDRYFYL